jgi:hypothetical protein
MIRKTDSFPHPSLFDDALEVVSLLLKGIAKLIGEAEPEGRNLVACPF